MDKHEIQSDLMWQIDRYLLGDDSFDRDAFELRMLDDEGLALAVAEEVGRLQSLAEAASRVTASSAPAASPFFTPRLVTIALLTMAASALCLIFALQGTQREDASALANASLDNSQLQQIALQWLVLEAEETESEALDFDADSVVMESVEAVGLGDPSSDWMMDATEFFRDADI